MMYTDTCLLTVVFAVLINTAYGLQCFECDSTLDPNCQEKFNHDFSINPLRPKQCNVWDGNYCIKITGVWGGIVGSHRFCSSRDLGNQCQDLFYPDHDRWYRACVYTCSGDDCNATSNIKSSWTLLATTVLPTVLLLWFKKV